MSYEARCKGCGATTFQGILRHNTYCVAYKPEPTVEMTKDSTQEPEQPRIPTLPSDSIREPLSDNPSPSKGLEMFQQQAVLDSTQKFAIAEKLEDILGQNYVDEYSGSSDHLFVHEIAEQLSPTIQALLDQSRLSLLEEVKAALPPPKVSPNPNNAQNSYEVGWNDYRQTTITNISALLTKKEGK